MGERSFTLLAGCGQMFEEGRVEDCPCCYKVPPFAFLAVYFDTQYVLSSAEGAAGTFIEPLSDALGVVLVLAEKE